MRLGGGLNYDEMIGQFSRLETSYRLLGRGNIFDILKKDILREYLYIDTWSIC